MEEIREYLFGLSRDELDSLLYDLVYSSGNIEFAESLAANAWSACCGLRNERAAGNLQIKLFDKHEKEAVRCAEGG